MISVLFRADASLQRGAGHVMRCLTLAQQTVAAGGGACFVSDLGPGRLQGRIEAEGFPIVHLQRAHPDPQDVSVTLRCIAELKAARQSTPVWVVLDGDHFDNDYRKRLRSAGALIVCIDDFGAETPVVADLIVNPNFGASRASYPAQGGTCEMLLGHEYVLLRNEFSTWHEWQRPIPSVGKRVLLTLGGADHQNMTLTLYRLLHKAYGGDLEVAVVLGHMHQDAHPIEAEMSARAPSHRLYRSVSDMAPLLAWADIAVISAGGTLWEALFMGCAVVSFAYTPYQESILTALAAQNVVSYLGMMETMDAGIFEQAIEEVVCAAHRRKAMARAGSTLIDGRGAKKILDRMRCGSAAGEGGPLQYGKGV